MADIKLSTLKPNGKNPRRIKDPRFEQLKKSLKEFPKMMELRPIIIDKQNKILAGNMRHRALKDLGFEAIPREWVKKAADLTEEERDRFILQDNDHAGTFDIDALAAGWDLDLAKGWGIVLPEKEEKTPVSFSASKTPKGTLLKVKCPSVITAEQLCERLIKEGFEVEIK